MHKVFFLIIILLLISCKPDLPVKGEFPDITLQSHDGDEFKFSQAKGKVLVVSYIFTNCPDICHTIGAKLNVFKDELKKDGLEDKVFFVSITIDPERDTKEALKHHAEMMNLDLTNWVFLTGDEESVKSTIKVAGIEAFKGPIEYSPEGKPSYTIAHLDRISLVDKEGRIRKHYKGTTFDMDELLGDMKSLL